MPVTEETYKRIALEDGAETWELVCGRLRKKPPMTHEHADIAFELAFRIRLQVDPRQYRIHLDNSRTRVIESSSASPGRPSPALCSLLPGCKPRACA